MKEKSLLMTVLLMILMIQKTVVAQAPIPIPVPPPMGNLKPPRGTTQPRALPSFSQPSPVNSPAPASAPTTAVPVVRDAQDSESEDDGGSIETSEDTEAPESGDEDEQQPSTLPGAKPAEVNPLNPAGSAIDRIVQETINQDLWAEMKGDLPCLEASDGCIAQLQVLATTKNPLLTDLDAKIEEINTRIEEAKKQNKQSVDLAVLTPAVQYIFQGTGVATTTTTTTTGSTTAPAPRRGVLGRLLGVFTSITGLNDLLSVIGVPVFQRLTGGNDASRTRDIAIADLAAKNAALVKDRALLANEIKNKVVTSVLEFDIAAREFQISQEEARREQDGFKLFEIEYRLGQGDTQQYLNSVRSLNSRKAAVYRAWTAMRRRVSEVKLLVLGQDEI